jgi:hypothetical protein
MSCTDTAKITGQHLLFLGVNTMGWSFAQFAQAAQFAKAHDVSSLLLKVADGAYHWYGGMDGYRVRRDIMKGIGVGVIPYIYSYGNKYNVLDAEIDILTSFMQEDGIVCMDAEQEWNGQVAWAQHLCGRMQGLGTFLVSTWADPSLQNWQGVLQALNPCVSAYMPQQYSDYLGTFWPEFANAGAACLQPTLDMTQDFGLNDPVALAKAAYDQGHTAISIWHYDTAIANPELLGQILAAFPKSEEETMTTIDLANSTVASHFTGNADNSIWTCKDNGFLVGHAILDFYRKFGGDALCGLSYLGLPLSNEKNVSGIKGVVYQRFERGVLCYDPNRPHVVDTPPGSEQSSVYLLHIDSGIGQDPRIADLQAQNSALQAEIVALQALPVVANMQQIQTIGQTIQDDIELIKKLAQIQ